MFDGPADSVTKEPLTLSRTPTLYVVLIVLVALPTLGVLAFSGVLGNAWCERFEIPEYEKAMGFRMGMLPVAGGKEVRGINWVEPTGILGRAGVLPGDVPRTPHGLGDFCADLSTIQEGRSVQLELINVLEFSHGGGGGHRSVTVGKVHK